MSEAEYMDPRKRIHRKWRRRHRFKVIGRFLAFLIIAGGLVFFGYRSYHHFKSVFEYESFPVPVATEPVPESPDEPFKLPTAAYGEKVEIEPGINATLQKVNVTKNGARFNVTASFLIDNLTEEDFRMNLNGVELIDGRGYTYFKEADKPDDKRQVGRLMAPAKKQSEVEVAFFLDHYAIFNQFSLLVGGRRIQIKAEGDPSTRFILGETVSFNGTQW
ncbi:hypothetical protein QPK87_07625 [Kamptonema cortianum]|nr:hypothetical protein [Oscillatoria laete-virens]MDK3156445.1 hypothetical protein [Kamptonema cortianum]MDL5046304.1 hypothetical protein [Oscillatoria amoena NRMC-F 0135]MDL5053874.1 hypothetical protein [Oscillatoria laete-virens NRMC-F 0139]